MSLLNICTAPFPVKSEYEAHFNIYAPLDLSDFQKWAIKSIVDGDNVLITAHTGSGKTLPAEFAIQHLLYNPGEGLLGVLGTDFRYNNEPDLYPVFFLFGIVPSAKIATT